QAALHSDLCGGAGFSGGPRPRQARALIGWGAPAIVPRARILKHDAGKWGPGFGKTSSSKKKLERDDESERKASGSSAANPKFAPQLPRVRLRTSGSKRH